MATATATKEAETEIGGGGALPKRARGKAKGGKSTASPGKATAPKNAATGKAATGKAPTGKAATGNQATGKKAATENKAPATKKRPAGATAKRSTRPDRRATKPRPPEPSEEAADPAEPPERIGDRTVHPAASVFPLNPPAPQRALEGSIAATGLLHPIVLLGEEILDGRNRLRACLAIGVDPAFQQVGEDVDPVDYVLRANLHRRHLTGSQRAVAAARLTALAHGRPSGEKGQDCRFSALQSAKLFGVSARLVRSARSVRRGGVPELVRAVERGDLSVGRAEEVAKVPREDQVGLLERFGTAPNKAEKQAVFAAVTAGRGRSGASAGGDAAPDEVVRSNRRESCVRRLATVLCDARDPERELREVCRELARLVGVSLADAEGGGGG